MPYRTLSRIHLALIHGTIHWLKMTILSTLFQGLHLRKGKPAIFSKSILNHADKKTCLAPNLYTRTLFQWCQTTTADIPWRTIAKTWTPRSANITPILHRRICRQGETVRLVMVLNSELISAGSLFLFRWLTFNNHTLVDTTALIIILMNHSFQITIPLHRPAALKLLFNRSGNHSRTLSMPLT